VLNRQKVLETYANYLNESQTKQVRKVLDYDGSSPAEFIKKQHRAFNSRKSSEGIKFSSH
jgi:hypothetical protein